MTAPRRTEVTRNGLYLEPCTFCPLDCRLCYTHHDRQRLLPTPVIERAVDVMLEAPGSLGIFWCGLGEIHTDPRFPSLLAALDERHPGRLLHSIQTNGQSRGRGPLPSPSNKFLLVSVDLPAAFCDEHRGRGYYERAVDFMAEQLAAGIIGVLVKCLLTVRTVPDVAAAFARLLDALATRASLPLEDVERRVTLEPVLPFRGAETAALASAGLRGNAWDEDREALLRAIALHLPSESRYLRERPRTVEVAVTVDGVFLCCEAVVPIATLDELFVLSRAELVGRLDARAPACEVCPLRDVC